jgi:cytoskeleton protein RodZ
MSKLGERFRAAREARGLSLSDVSEQIRIRSVYLGAIEEENWSAIGAPVYIRGFLRTYARFLGLDPEEVVTAFNAVPAAGPPPAPSPARASRQSPISSADFSPIETERRRIGPWALWTAGFVAALLIAFVVYNELTMRRSPVPTVAAASEAPTALPSNSPGAAASSTPAGSPNPAAPDGAKTLALVLSAPSWLRVTVDGSVSMEGTFPAGTAKTFHGKYAYVRIGNAGGVEIFVDGKDLGKLGKSGDVVDHTFTL